MSFQREMGSKPQFEGKETDSWPKPDVAVATVGGKNRVVKDKTLKVRMTPQDFYVLDELVRKAGNPPVATVVRDLIYRAEVLDIAADVVKALADRDESEKRLAACVARFKIAQERGARK